MRTKTSVLLVLLYLQSLIVSGQDLEKGVHNIAVALASDMNKFNIKKIGVIEFTDLSGYRSVLGQFIAEELITDLLNVSSGQFDVVERRQLAKVLSEQKLGASGLFDPASITSVGKILGIQALVTGSITDLGSEVKINARVIAVETARVFAASSAKVLKEGTVERLLYQGASPESGAEKIGAEPLRRQGQASDVFFQNVFLRIEVKSMSVSSDKYSASLALVFKNISGGDLLLAAARDKVELASNTGISRVVDVAGLPLIDPFYKEDLKDVSNYAVLGAGSETTVVLKYWSVSTPLDGNIFAFSGEFVRYTGSGGSRFTAGISNIEMR